MKHFVRDMLINIFYYTGIVYVYRVFQAKKGPLVRVLAFHDVADRVWFESIISMLDKEFNVVTPDQFHSKDFNSTKINILLTFDDGYQSWIDTCVPVLEKYNCKGLFFINSGLLDVAEDIEKVENYMRERLFLSPKTPLTWDGATLLIEKGHSIGGHTVTHPSLAMLEINEAHEEVGQDKKRIEQMLNITIKDFAYPYGTKKDSNSKTIQTISEVGYAHQYSAITGFVSSTQTEKTLIPRTLLEKNQKLNVVRQWVFGGYDCFRQLHTI